MATILKIYFELLLNRKSSLLETIVVTCRSKIAKRGGWVRQRCHISCVTRASNWDWLTVGQGLLSLQQVRLEGECFLFLHCHSFSFLPCPSLSSPRLSLLSFFSLSLGDDTKWPTRVDVSLNPNTIKIAKIVQIGNPRWPPLPPSSKSVLTFFFWTKIDRKYRGDL